MLFKRLPLFVVFLLNKFTLVGNRYIFVEIVSLNSIKDAVLLTESESVMLSVKPRFVMNESVCRSFVNIKNKLVILKDISVVGGSNVIRVGDGKVICEQNYYNSKHNFYIRDPDVYADARDSLILTCPIETTTIESGILLSGNGSYNYYHFMFEFVAKTMILENIELDQRIPFLIDKSPLSVPQFRSLIEKFNFSNRDIICIENDRIYKIKQCYYINPVNIISSTPIDNHKISYKDILFSLSSLDYLRSNLLKSKSKRIFPKKIFLSRKNATSARSYNEADVVAIFEKNGFVVVYPELLSIDDQISMFNNAQYIAGASGAAFSNLIFCNSSCKALIISSSTVELSVFSTIADHVGVDLLYYFAHDKRYVPKSIHEKFHIDVNDLLTVVRDFFCDPHVEGGGGPLPETSILN